MISLEEAQERILAAIEPLPAEEIPVQDALGRYLAAPIHSPIDLPPADNSAMDGYAVRAADLASATGENPVALRLSGETRAGSAFAGGVEAGACVRIYTGAILPRGADAVVMQEDVKQAADNRGRSSFRRRSSRGKMCVCAAKTSGRMRCWPGPGRN